MSLHTTQTSPLILSKDTIFVSTITLSDNSVSSNNKYCSANGCRKKLTMTDFTCRCGIRFCMNHRFPETHTCTFDFKTIGKTQLQDQLLKCDGDKLADRI